MRGLLVHLPRSLTVRLALFFAIFLLLPILLYAAFRVEDIQRNQLILRAADQEGRTIAQGISRTLEGFSPGGNVNLEEVLQPFAGPERSLKLFYQPSGDGPGGFFYMAALPILEKANQDAERATLESAGIFTDLAGQCAAGRSIAKRFTNPQGREELVTSVTPLALSNGCWALLVSHRGEAYLASSLGRSFWAIAPMRIAVVSYAFVTLLAAWLFWDVRLDMRRIVQAARDMRSGRRGSSPFKSRIRMPELAEMAAELDRLVAALERSQQLIRQAAEENAHAFKTPLAVIQQSLEPLRRADQKRLGNDITRSVDVIGQAAERLDALVSAARTLDTVAADTLDSSGEKLALTPFLHHVSAAFTPVAKARSVSLLHESDDALFIEASSEPLETIIENLFENALSFSPSGGVISLNARKIKGAMVEIEVRDEGPGVAEGELEKIFDRYYSARPAQMLKDEPMHFGLGLWIVRRNTEALGGYVYAKNGENGGFSVHVVLPLY